ncbi:hypothetical protein [Nonomuraea basaltis]|uniref:hypothetical protein n=1 Tax=Nonomuraea basaltis TaxID=2495887 RepID=UPI00110C5AEF|nr:hypothetical protein [Nonomuraea basaltis]TMR90773.1 hypothetical protein EJK15_53630 [Nonomuraea basaltis]
MALLREFAGRFRPAGVPGAAAPVGVPADLQAAREAEVEPVFAALAETTSLCADLWTEAETDARETIQQAQERSASILATARSRAVAERADALARARNRRSAESQAVLAEARRAAEVIGARAAARIPGLVERVIGRIRELGARP